MQVRGETIRYRSTVKYCTVHEILLNLGAARGFRVGICT